MELQKADISTTLQNESMNTIMLKGAQNQIKILRVTSKLSHWDLRLKCNKQYINLQEYPGLEADLWLKSNEQDNNLQEYPDVRTVMQEYAEECNDFEKYSGEYNETNVEKGIQPELDSVQQHIKVKDEIIEELDSFDNLTQVKEEVLSDIDIDENENNMTDFSDVNIRVKEESQPSESTYSTSDEINKHSKQVDAIPNHFDKVDKVLKHYKKVKNSLKTEKKLDAISGPEFSTFQCNVCFKAFLGDDAYNEHMKKHTTKDMSSAEVVPSNRVVKIGNRLSDNWVMVKVKKFRVKRLANDKANESKTTKIYFTSSSAIEVDNDRCTDQVYDNDSKKSVKINGDRTVTIDNDPVKVNNDSKVKVDEDYDNSVVKENKDLLIEIPGKTKVVKLPEGTGFACTQCNYKVEVDNDNKFKVDNDNDSSTVKENKDLLVEIPGKTRAVKLPKGKRKLPKERTKTCYEHHNENVIYRVCDENCTNKKYCTQSKECRKRSTHQSR